MTHEPSGYTGLPQEYLDLVEKLHQGKASNYEVLHHVARQVRFMRWLNGANPQELFPDGGPDTNGDK